MKAKLENDSITLKIDMTQKELSLLVRYFNDASIFYMKNSIMKNLSYDEGDAHETSMALGDLGIALNHLRV